MKLVQRYIYKQVSEQKLAKEDAKLMLQELHNSSRDKDFAIIGMAGKMPGADDLKQYWVNLCGSKSNINEFPNNRWEDCAPLASGKKADYRKGGYLEEIDKFDTEFFNISPQEAKYMNPMQRLLLQTSYEAIEDAGYGGERIYGSNAGVYIGVESTSILNYNQLFSKSDSMMFTGSMNGILASRISFHYNLKGPSMVIDTACSSSLTAIIMACQALESNQCDLAIVGGICLNLLPSLKKNILDMVESGDDLIRAFDQNANGTSWGEAVGLIVIKPLWKAIKDGDSVQAVIKGWAINNDGASNGITAPDAKAQEAVIVDAWKNAEINPESIQYIETHGTGTILGDPIEIKGITNAFQRFTEKKQFCAIGSVKTNIGHTVGASGIVSLIKVVLMLKHKKMVASLNFSKPNKFIQFIESPVFVNDILRDWEKGQEARRAGISSFGFSGTNCHIIVEEAIQAKYADKTLQEEQNVFIVSAKNKDSIKELIQKYYYFFLENSNINLADVCYTANTGRGHYNFRLVIICESLVDLVEKLKHIVTKGFDKILSNEVFYGEHNVVSIRTDNKKNEITEQEKNKLSENANTKIIEYLKKNDIEVLKEICQKYVNGADVKWIEMYRNLNCKKVNLPTYPFRKIRCWSDKSGTGKLDNNIRENIHPLLDYCVVDSIYNTIYKTKFSVSRHWILSEHKVNGLYTVPGVSYIEMAGEIGKIHFGCGSWKIQELVFIHPLVVDAQMDKEVHTVIQKHNDYFKFTIASKDKEQWIKHAEGKFTPLKEVEASYFNIPEIKRKCNKKKAVQYTYDETDMVDVGPRWNVIEKLQTGDNEVLVHLNLPEKYNHDMNEYFIHPTLMDCAMNAAINLIGEGLYLPWCYKSIEVYSQITKECYSYLRRKERGDANAEVATFDIVVVDNSGKVLIEVTDYTIKKVRNAHQKSEKLVEKTECKNQYRLKRNEEYEEKSYIFEEQGHQNNSKIQEIVNQRKVISEIGGREEYRKIDENIYEDKSNTKFCVKLIGKKNDDYNIVEMEIANIWGKVLGVSVINVYDNFNKIGGNSILAIKLLNEIEAIYPNMVEIADIFTYSTINQFAEMIIKKSRAKNMMGVVKDGDQRLMEILNRLKDGDISIDEGLESI